MAIQDLPIVLAILAFAVMGVGAIVRPGLVTSQFGISDLTSAARSEVRAVYGGFGISVALVLGVALFRPGLRDGILFTVAAALGGMAMGRVVSAVIDRGIDRVPLCYLILEVIVAVMLTVGT
jgi:hypothetical protein